MISGYSGTPLARKLGIKDGTRMAIVNAPARFESELSPLPENVIIKKQVRAPLDVILFFAKGVKDLESRLGDFAGRLDRAGGLWIAWPKKSSGVLTDLDFNAVQSAGLAAGLVDNKICAVNEIWSGLRFVYRKKDRPARKKGKN